MSRTSVLAAFVYIWACFAITAQAAAPPRRQGPAAIEALKREGRFESLRAAYRDTVQRTSVHFEAKGPVFSTMGREYSMELVGFGKPASQTSEGRRTEYRRTGLVEWYVNDPSGIEQGFTVEKRPQGSGQLTLVLQMKGGLAVAPGDGGAVFRDGQRTLASYRGLKSWDASGRVLASRMEISEREVRLVIDDRAARYPVTVDPWLQTIELVASDFALEDTFGSSVAVSGNTAIIGAPQKTANGFGSAGVAYIFTNTGSGWVQQAELIASDAARSDQFGTSVALSGGTALIGAFSKTVNGFGGAGAVYVFTGSGNNWTQQAELTASDAAQADFFGTSVALSAGTALIGANHKLVNGNPLVGAAYIFTGSGSSWSQQAELTASDALIEDDFGVSVALDGDTALIGADTATANGRAGVAYIFTGSGSSWSQQAQLMDPSPVAGDHFGYSVALAGGTALIGAYGGIGYAYVFTGSGSSWTQQAQLIGVPYHGFGYSVALSGDIALIGSIFLEADIFTRSGASWTASAQLVPWDVAANTNYFAYSVALDGNTAFVGAPWMAVGGVYYNAGSTYVYTLNIPPAAITATSGTLQSTGIGTAFTLPLQATVTDTNGHPVPGATVTFTAPSSGASASFNSYPTATAITDGNGLATSPVPIANTVAGSYSVAATVSGVSAPAIFTLTNIAPTGITVDLSPGTVVGGKSVNGKVSLLFAAPAGGLPVNLSSSDASAATVPSSVTVNAGAKSATFSITTSPLAVGSTITISAASLTGLGGSANLVVNPPGISSLKVAPSSVVGSVSATACTVTLNGVAPTAGITVQLTSTDPSAIPPSTVVVPAGQSVSAAFTIATRVVTAPTTVTITATFNGTSKTDTLVVNPLDVSTLTLAPATVPGGDSSTSNRVKLNAPALATGAVVTLSSDTPAVATVPASVTVAAGSATSPNFTIATNAVTIPTTVTVTATYNGLSTQSLLTVNPASLSALKVVPASVVGSVTATGSTVTLEGLAPAGGITVQLVSSDTSAIPPPTVVVPAGQSVSAAFPIATTVVTAPTTVTITATYNGIAKMDTLVVNPLAVSALTLAPATVSGGLSTTSNRVKLNAPSPASGAVVILSSDTPAVATVPSSVTVAPGSSTSPNFVIATSAVTTPTTVTITATYNGISIQSLLTVNPASLSVLKVVPATVVGGVSATGCTVTLEGLAPAGGITVQLVSSDPSAIPPATVVVPAGQSVSPAFAIATTVVTAPITVTITATYNGVSKTDTLLVNP